MEMTKTEALQLVADLPESFDPEELQYRLYLRGKLESAEREIQDGHSMTHDEVVRETSSWTNRT